MPSPAAGVADAVGVGVGVALTEPVAVVGVVATAAASFSKKTTTSNDGGLPTPHGCGVAELELARSTPGRRVVTSSAPELAQRDARDAIDVVQARHQAGDLGLAGSAALERDRRSGDRAAERLPPPPAPVLMSPASAVSVTSAGTARERSRSACSQSKREPARSRTVCTRALAIVS